MKSSIGISLINPLITLTIVFSFLQFFLGETPRFQRLLTITVHVGNQQPNGLLVDS